MKGLRLEDLRTTFNRLNARLTKDIGAEYIVHDAYQITVPLKEGPTNTMKKPTKTKPKKVSPLSNLGMYSTITKGIRDAVKELLEQPTRTIADANVYDKRLDMTVHVYASRGVSNSQPGGTGSIDIRLAFDPLKLLGITS